MNTNISHENMKENVQGIYETIKSLGVSFVVQQVKNLPALWETQVQFLGQEDSLEKEIATYSSILAMDRGAWQATVHGVAKESDTSQ